jgi:hypothetical protein
MYCAMAMGFWVEQAEAAQEARVNAPGAPGRGAVGRAGRIGALGGPAVHLATDRQGAAKGGESGWSHHRTTVPTRLNELNRLSLQEPANREPSRQPVAAAPCVDDRLHLDLVHEEASEDLARLGRVPAEERHHVLDSLSQISLESRGVQ